MVTTDKQPEALQLADALTHQRQCDEDGTEIAVSREAVHFSIICLRTQHATITAQSALIERMKMEAQIHAQEARTANATIAEIYQCVCGATGEPGNWNGAEPVREKLTAQDARIAELERDAARLDHLQKRGSTVELVNISDECRDFRVGGLHAAVSPSIRTAIDAAMQQGERNGI